MTEKRRNFFFGSSVCFSSRFSLFFKLSAKHVFKKIFSGKKAFLKRDRKVINVVLYSFFPGSSLRLLDLVSLARGQPF